MELGGYLIEELEFIFSLSNLTKYKYTSVYIYRVGGRKYNNDIKLILNVSLRFFFLSLDYIIGSNGLQYQLLRWSGEKQSDHKRTSIVGKLNSCSLYRKKGLGFHFPLALDFICSVV